MEPRARAATPPPPAWENGRRFVPWRLLSSIKTAGVFSFRICVQLNGLQLGCTGSVAPSSVLLEHAYALHHNLPSTRFVTWGKDKPESKKKDNGADQQPQYMRFATLPQGMPTVERKPGRRNDTSQKPNH